jgi:tetratricopeptide (TPR) repeat protein
MLGRFPDGIAQLRSAIEIDPLAAEVRGWLGLALLAAGNPTRARQALLQAVEVAPEYDWVLMCLAMSQLTGGESAAALETMRRSRSEGWRLWGEALAHHVLGAAAESGWALRALTALVGDAGASRIAEYHARRGNRDRALERLERAYRGRDSGLSLATGPAASGSARRPLLEGGAPQDRLPDGPTGPRCGGAAASRAVPR